MSDTNSPSCLESVFAILLILVIIAFLGSVLKTLDDRMDRLEAFHDFPPALEGNP